jgi:hypothetical protein
MRIKARITGAAVLGVAALVAAGASASPAAAAGSVPTATIVSPSADQAVSGSVDVTVSIGQIDPSDPVTSVTFAITSGSDYRKEQTRIVSGGSCVSSCLVTATFDTASQDLTTYSPSAPIDALPDGPATFTADVETASGSAVGAEVSRTIDNQRPSLALPDLGTLYGSDQRNWLGYKAMNTRVLATPSASTSRPVSTIELHLVDGPGAPDVWSAAAPAGGSGYVSFPLSRSDYPEWDAYAVAVDDSGKVSAPIPVWLRKYYRAALVAVDSGVQFDGIPQIDGYAAHVDVVPRWTDGPAQTDTWVTAVSAEFDGRPVAAADHLHAFGAVPLDLHNTSSMAFYSGEHQLSVAMVNSDGSSDYASIAIWVVNPVSATWTLGTTRPDTPTRVSATIDNTSGSAIHSIQLEQDLTAVGDPVIDPAAPTAAQTTMSFAPGSHYLSALVTLANGNTYRVFHHVMSLVEVESSVDAPDESTWGDTTTFHAATISAKGVAQSGLRVQLQSKAAGSTRWISQAAAVTNRLGTARMSVPTSRTGNATWRVVSALTKTQSPSTSHTHVVRVRAAFGRLPSSRSVRVGRLASYHLAIKPSTSATRVDIQARRTGSTGWTTLSHVRVGRSTTAVPVRLHRAGAYQIRVVVDGTRAVTRTASRAWSLRVTR